MINRINILIDVNLKILYNSKGNLLNLKDFKDDIGNKFQDVETFARIMQKKELIIPTVNEEFCFKLTKIGKQIYENGGWLEHLKNQKEVKNETVKIKPKKIIFSLLIIAFIFIIILLLTKNN
jgi:hypothetical protein